jgi:arylsulfatase A-like enzyme
VSLYRRYIAYYYALVTEVDHHIGNILDVLRKEGLERDTIVVYTSDHGDFVGAHGMIEKSAAAHNVYEDTLRVPLIIRVPGNRRKGQVAGDLVELIDIYPTLLDLAGIERPKDYTLPGRSLVLVVKDGKPLGRRFAVSENLIQVSVITERHKLGTWLKPQADGYGDMLFDREHDPYETHNFLGDPEYAEVEKQLRDHLRDWTARTQSAVKD